MECRTVRAGLRHRHPNHPDGDFDAFTGTPGERVRFAGNAVAADTFPMLRSSWLWRFLTS